MKQIKCFPGLLLCATVFLSVWAINMYVSTFGNPLDSNPFADCSFNKNTWMGGDNCTDGMNCRSCMADDILKKLHNGMGEYEVKTMLDEPQRFNQAEIIENAERFDKNERQAHTILTYYLGNRISMIRGIDRAWLQLSFDTDHRYIYGRVFAPQ